jgi:ATP-dependent RNA helicase RhlB
VVSEEEMKARKAAHEAWSMDSFVVDPVEGKKRFHDFDLPSEVMHGIADLGFKYCTEIQALSLEQALAGKNIAGKAQTGSGKTAAFLVAILTRYLRTPEHRAKAGGTPRALVIAPTRELVIQICKDADAIGKYCGLRSLAIYGGMDYDRQRKEVLDAPVDLLVATPGRLLDFVKSHVINLSNVDTLVIDEADRMLDMGFIPDVRRIMSYLPPKDRRATMLYSATLNDTVMRLAMNWMEEPYKAEVESETNATDTVRQVVYIVRSADKFKVLYNHIALHPAARTIVFCNRKSTTEDVYESLKIRGVAVEMLSGDVNQNKRLKVLDAFRDGEIRIVVATDVAGRGIHVDDIEYVINFDFPYEAEDYVHRIGRTGRAGNTGIAISFADEDESFAIPEIEEYIKEPLKCTMIQEDDPLLKPIPPRGSKLGEVDESAAAAVDAREAVGEEQKAAAAAMTGVAAAANAVTGTGAPAILREDHPVRELPKFEHALDEKSPPPDESDIYSKPVEQTAKTEEFTI